MVRKIFMIGLLLLLVTAGVVMLLTSNAQAATYTQKQLAFVDEFGEPISHTTLTSVTIIDAGTASTSTIYSDRIGTSMTNPIVTGLAADQITFWSRDADYKCTATDGTYTRTVDNLTGSQTRFAFPTYLVAMSSRTASDDQTFIWGDDSDVTSQWIDGTSIFRWTPDSDGVSYDIGSTLVDKQFVFHVYVGGISGGGLTINEGTGAFTYVSASGAIAFDATGSGAFGVHTGAATGAITLGSGTSGAWAVDGTSTGTLNADDSIGVTTTGGSADITVDAIDGSVIIDGGEADAAAIVIQSTGGGLDLTAIDNIDMTLTAAAAADDFSITVAGSQNASIHLASDGTSNDAITLITSAGGIDITVAGAATGEDLDLTSNMAINLTSSEAADSAIVIATSNAAGQIVITSTDTTVDGIDINASGGIDIDTADDFTLDVAGASGEDILVTNTGGSIYVKATESAGDAVKIEATTGGIDIFASGAAASEDIDIVATGSSVNITSTEGAAEVCVTDAIVLSTSNRGLIDIKGAMNFNTTYCIFKSNPVVCKNDGTAVAGAASETDFMAIDGTNFEYFTLTAGTQAIKLPTITANGLDVRLDALDNEGMEMGEGITARSKSAFTIGTDAFYLKVKFYLTDVNDFDIMAIGFRLAAAYNQDLYAYNTYAGINVNNGTVNGIDDLNGSAAHETDMEEDWLDGTAHTLEIRISSGKAVTQYFDGAAVTTPLVFSWTDTDTVVPFFHILGDATAAGEVAIQSWECGLQN